MRVGSGYLNIHTVGQWLALLWFGVCSSVWSGLFTQQCWALSAGTATGARSRRRMRSSCPRVGKAPTCAFGSRSPLHVSMVSTAQFSKWFHVIKIWTDCNWTFLLWISIFLLRGILHLQMWKEEHWEIIRLEVWTGWSHCMKMELMAFWQMKW